MYIGERPVIGGTSPRPFSSAPWQIAQAMVLPPAPVVTSSSPFLTLPVGTWATKPARGSRLSALRSFCGSSMMRLPIGSVPPFLPPGSAWRHCRDRTSARCRISTTLYHTGYLIDPKYAAAALVSSSVNRLGDLNHDAAAHALADAGFEFGHLAHEVLRPARPEMPADSGWPPPLVRWHRSHANPFGGLAVGDDVRHRRVIFRIPVGRTEPVVDLGLGVLLGAARQLNRLGGVRRLRRRRRPDKPIAAILRRRLCLCLCRHNRQCQQAERRDRNQSPHSVPPCECVLTERQPRRHATNVAHRNECAGH